MNRVRKIDELGRLILPAELRNEWNLAAGDSVELASVEGGILLRRHRPSCAVCGTEAQEDLTRCGAAYLCAACVAGLQRK